MNTIVAVISGGTVGAVVAGAYLLGRHHGTYRTITQHIYTGQDDDDLASVMRDQANRTPVGASTFVELERLDEDTVRAIPFRMTFGGEDS